MSLSVHFAARPEQPPLSLEGARSLQALLADQLKDDDDAVDAYVAGLCAYMDSPSRVRSLSVMCSVEWINHGLLRNILLLRKLFIPLCSCAWGVSVIFPM